MGDPLASPRPGQGRIVREKRKDWDRLQGCGIRVYQTTGEDGRFDFDRARDADIIVATPEKWDAISRHGLGPGLVKRIGTIVVDEAHLVGEAGRGPGQEAMLARLPQIFPMARIVAMSGTLRNASARWLDADLFTSEWRAVALRKEVVPYKKVGSALQDVRERNAIVTRLVRPMQDQGGATLVFCASRNGVRECARQLARGLDLPALTLDERVTDADLRETLRRGIGFLYSGHPDYATVERLFRARALTVLVATTTAAAGVNLPARAVVVRDLYKGMTKLSPSDLGQMAGRAGRQGLEDKGYCYVIAPQDHVARVTTMLDGHPVGSRLGDDLATHINTEIVLGHVRSRPDVERWYGRTLHAVVAPQRPDLIAALRHLLVNGLVVQRDEALEPTALGRATSDAMVRVDTAIALERFLAGRTTRTPDPTTLEEELLRAVCGLPVELDEVVSRPEGEHLRKALSRYDARLARWPGGRLQYLALAACLLCGVDVRRVGVEDARSLSAQVQTDISRFLGFLARRANERTPGAPDVMVAAGGGSHGCPPSRWRAGAACGRCLVQRTKRDGLPNVHALVTGGGLASAGVYNPRRASGP